MTSTSAVTRLALNRGIGIPAAIAAAWLLLCTAAAFAQGRFVIRQISDHSFGPGYPVTNCRTRMTDQNRIDCEFSDAGGLARDFVQHKFAGQIPQWNGE